MKQLLEMYKTVLVLRMETDLNERKFLISALSEELISTPAFLGKSRCHNFINLSYVSVSRLPKMFLIKETYHVTIVDLI